MATNNKPDFRNEALKHISEIIREDILPLLINADLHQVTIDNPIKDVFHTGLNITVKTNIEIQSISNEEFERKEFLTRQQYNHRGQH